MRRKIVKSIGQVSFTDIVVGAASIDTAAEETEHDRIGRLLTSSLEEISALMDSLDVLALRRSFKAGKDL